MWVGRRASSPPSSCGPGRGASCAAWRPASWPPACGPRGGAVEHLLVAAVEQRLERHLGAGVGAQALDEQGLALLDAVLLAAGLDDRVGHGQSSAESEPPPSAAVPALARERRRPPLRPRR